MTSTVIGGIYTSDAYLRLPESDGFELVDGEPVECRASEATSRVGARIGYLLQTETEKSRDAFVYGADLAYGCTPDPAENVCRANVSLIRADRLRGLGDPEWMPIPADLVVYVPVPTETMCDVNRKVERYLASGFALVWVVDPEQRIVYVHRADGSVSKFREQDEIIGEAALPGLRRTVGEFFKR